MRFNETFGPCFTSAPIGCVASLNVFIRIQHTGNVNTGSVLVVMEGKNYVRMSEMILYSKLHLLKQVVVFCKPNNVTKKSKPLILTYAFLDFDL